MKSATIVVLALALAGCSGNRGAEITASGTIESTDVTVSAKVGGEITRLLVDEGAEVNKGDTLALIDRADLVIQLKQTRANALAMEAQYRLARSGSRAEDIAQAEASFANAADDMKRAEALLEAQSITRKQFDDTRTRYIVAQQAYEKVKRGLRAEEIEAARARRDLADAQVEAILKKLSDSYVTAPMPGVITEKGVEQGAVVLPNGSMFRISRLDRVHLMIYISEVELAGVKLGQEARVYIDGRPGEPLAGRVTYISDRAEFTPKNVQTKDDRTKLVFAVKIEVPNPDRLLKPGMPADARIAVIGS